MGLWNLALEYNIAFVPDFEEQRVDFFPDPVLAGKNIALSIGKTYSGPVHGFSIKEGVSIFPSGNIISRMDVSGTIRHSMGLEKVVEALSNGIESSKHRPFVMDKALSTALDLYLGNFYERSIRARFLTLMMALEAMAPLTEKHTAAQIVIKKWKGEIQEPLTQTYDKDTRDALEALGRELNFRRETSIRRRVRKLILDEAPFDDCGKESLAKKVVGAYDLRGKLAHSGSVDDNKLHEAFDITLQAVKTILRVRFGLDKLPVNRPDS